MKITDVKIRMYVAEDGTEFHSQIECEKYEKSLIPLVIKPEWIERHQKQIAENNIVKEILLKAMVKNEKYILTDLYFELLPQFDFLRKRMTIQRLTALTRQLRCEGLINKTEEHRQAYFSKI